MDKTSVMAISTALKFLAGLAGVVACIFLVIVGLIKKDNNKLKRAALVFVGTWIGLILLSAVEFLILFNA